MEKLMSAISETTKAIKNVNHNTPRPAACQKVKRQYY